METGKYYVSNQERFAQLPESELVAALVKCKEHIRLRLRQRTLSGAHSASNLGTDPIDHYLGVAYEKILGGDWEWKMQFSLSDQMIRIADSYISKEVQKTVSKAREAVKGSMESTGEFEEFQSGASTPTFKIVSHDPTDLVLYEKVNEEESLVQSTIQDAQLQMIESATAGDEDLEFIVEALKEGKGRTEIAEILGKTPRQFDKLREKLIRKIKLLRD